jgi:hypothetical protein
MITNHILEDKWRVQRALTEQAGHDPSRYLALVHAKAIETQERYRVQFRYIGEEPAFPTSPKES